MVVRGWKKALFFISVILVVASFSSTVHASGLDDDDAATPAVVPMVDEASAQLAQLEKAEQELKAVGVVNEDGEAAQVHISGGSDDDEDNDDEKQALLGTESESESELEVSLPSIRKYLRNWRRIKTRDWKKLAAKWRKASPFQKRAILSLARKYLGKDYKAFARRFGRAVGNKKRGRTSRKSLRKSRKSLRKSRKSRKSRKTRKSRKSRKSLRKRFRGGRKSRRPFRFRPSWPKARFATRFPAGWQLIKRSKYVDTTCHSARNVWALRKDGIAVRFIGGKKLQAAPRVKTGGGLMSIATTCGSQLWGLTRSGRVVTFRRGYGWRSVALGPRFVKLEVGGNDRGVYALTRHGKLYRLTKRGGGRWIRTSRFQTLRDIAVTCDNQVVGINRNFNVVYRTLSGEWFPMTNRKGRFAYNPKVKSIAVSTRRQGVFAVTHGGRVVVFRSRLGRWVAYPKIRVDSIAVSKTGQMCAVRGRNFFLYWAGRKVPSTSRYSRFIGKGRQVTKTPEPADPKREPLLRNPFALGARTMRHAKVLTGFASPLPTRPRKGRKAYVRDNLPLSTLDFVPLKPTLPGTFQTYTNMLDGSSEPKQDPLPDPKQELSIRGGFSIPGSNTPTSRGKSAQDHLNEQQIRSLNLGFRASATPGGSI